MVRLTGRCRVRASQASCLLRSHCTREGQPANLSKLDLLEIGKQAGVRVQFEDTVGDENWDDVLDELEDPWMRKPASPTEGLWEPSESGKVTQSAFRTAAEIRTAIPHCSISQAVATCASGAGIMLDVSPGPPIEKLSEVHCVPLNGINESIAEQCQAKQVFVIDRGHYDSVQAAVRLMEVLKIEIVNLVEIDDSL